MRAAHRARTAIAGLVLVVGAACGDGSANPSTAASTPSTSAPTSTAAPITSIPSTPPPETAPPDSAPPTELVVNGGFELPDVPTGDFSWFAEIPGWAVSTGTFIEVLDGVSGSPFDGTQFVELDSSENSGMYQDLQTEATQTYLLSFAYTPRPGRTAEDNTIAVFWDGELTATLSSPGEELADTAWVVETFEVTASTSATRLEFQAQGESNEFGGYLDAVSVVAR